MSWKHQSPRNVMENYCGTISVLGQVKTAIQVGRLDMSTDIAESFDFRLLVMIDPIGQDSCIGFFLSFTSLNPYLFFLLCNYYYYAT